MKKIQGITIAALTASLLGGGVVSVFAGTVADPVDEKRSEAIVRFKEGKKGIVDPPIEGESNNPYTPEVKGPLGIAYVPEMNFGTHEITTQTETYSMKTEKRKAAKKEDGKWVVENPKKEISYPSYAQVRDVRGSETGGWKLTAQLSPFTSTTKHVLKGAEIKMTQTGQQVTDEDSPTFGDGSTKEITLKTKKEEDGTQVVGEIVPIMSAAGNGNQGNGTTAIVWGDESIIGQADVMNESIKLTVPGKSTKRKAEYKATINWELSTTVANN